MQYRYLIGAIGLSAAVSLTAGCRSAVSTHVTPDPYDGGWNTKKVRGIPVTVLVPTHLEVHVVERRYYQPGGDFELIPGAVTRFVTEKVREKQQLFMVDAARPAAGSLGFKATFADETTNAPVNPDNPQFFNTYNSKVTDTTIKTITDLIPGLPGVLTNLKKARAIADTGTTPADASLAMAYTDHLVAVKVFDVNDPNLTECVRQFMAEHVNCHPVCPANCATSPK